MAKPKEIIVVGAGIVGASIAWHLAKAGAKVTIVEAGGLGGVATPASFAWINASWSNPEPYFRLRMRSMAEWKRLAAECPGIPLRWVGGLLWDLPRDQLEAYADEHGSWGYGIRRVDRAGAARIEPNLADPPDFALHVAEEGAVEPDAAARALVADAVRLGARLLGGTEVEGLIVEGGVLRGVADCGQRVRAQTRWCSPPAPPRHGLPQLPASKFRSKRRRACSSIHALRRSCSTASCWPISCICARPWMAASLPEPISAAPIRARTRQKQRVLSSPKCRRCSSAGRRLELERHSVGYRPTPADGFPIIGRADGVGGLYLAVMHSGITLAPAVGLFAAQEILEGDRDPLLAPYGLSRFAPAEATSS